MEQAQNSKYKTFTSFYPFYLSEHQNRTCRRLHFLGSSLVLACIGLAIAFRDWRFLLAMPLVGYGFAWVGHFGFEKNKPASFKQPFYSFIGDWVMFKDILIGKIPF